MKITKIKINGVDSPMGHDTRHVKVSWIVADSRSKAVEHAQIEVSDRLDFSRIIFQKGGKELDSVGELLRADLAPRKKYYVRIFVTGDAGDYEKAVTSFETGKRDEPWQAQWIGPARQNEFHPILSRPFMSDQPVAKARLYVCGLGLYEAYINGKKAGNEYLTPNLNDYQTDFQVQTYDVTDMISRNNLLEIHLGNGWYKGRFLMKAEGNTFGDRFAAIAELYIEYDDGSVELIQTDKDWTYRGSDVESSDIYDGEKINRLLWNPQDHPAQPVDLVPLDRMKLTDRYSLPVTVKHILPVKEIIHTPAGETVLDMGQNFAGFIRFKSNQPKGAVITLDFGEVLQHGNFYNDNYRTAKSQFIYVSNGSEEIVQPHFTFFGFRYVRVSGWTGALIPTHFEGCVLYSDLEETGGIRTSHEKINRLFQNCMWSQRSNSIDIPTDCPQRDERLGWTGDANVFAPTACFNMDMRAFYDKWIRDLRSEQIRFSGGLPYFTPSGGNTVVTSVWGDIGAFLPALLYQHYGDLDAARRYYPMMRDWVDYVERKDREHGGARLYHFGYHIGDWVALDGASPQSVLGRTDEHFIASAYYYQSALLTAGMAEKLGIHKDANRFFSLAKSIKQAIFKEYYTPSGRLAIDTQTAYIIALRFGIYIDKGRIIKDFKNRLMRDEMKIKGGFIGATSLCTVLSDNGMDDIAYDFLFQEDFPSWLYCVNLGATTLWERWNSLLPDGTVSGTKMNSFNHYSFGAVVEFMYRGVAGIQSVEPGFKRALFKPRINSHLHFAHAYYNSASGRYVSNWQIHDDGSVSVHFEVPFGCSALAVLPRYEGKPIELEPGSFDLHYQPIKDFRLLYSMESMAKDLLTNEEVVGLLKQMIPEYDAMVEAMHQEFLHTSLENLLQRGEGGIDPKFIDAVSALIGEILAIKRV